MDEGGVEQAVKAFLRNDPFYPRPGDGKLWEEFRGTFLQTSKDILGEEGPEARLPALWIQPLETRRPVCIKLTEAAS